MADFLGEVHSYIEMLQKAIAEVSHVKANLKTTASDLKSQIRDSISRHLEALRNRETWLLGQVEVVQHAKEDVLRQQQAELNKVLGKLQSTCALLEQGGKVLDAESLECHVKESLTVVGGLSLSPDETKEINFVAQNFELQEFIQKFGVVVSDNPVVDKQMVSEVPGFGKKSTFFTPSGPCEEWLLKSNGTSTSQDLLKIPCVKLNIQDWLQQKTVPVVSTTEISFFSPDQHPKEHWLSKGQTQNSSTKPGNGVSNPEKKALENQAWLLDTSRRSASTAITPSDLFSYYTVVKMSESSQWLKKPGITEDKLSTNLIGDTYRNIASSSADILLKKKKKVQSTGSSIFSRSISTQSCSDCSCGLASGCCDSDAQKKSAEFDDTSSEISDWLAVQKEDVETSSSIVAPPSEAHDNDQWLLKQSCEADISTQDYTGIKSYKENLAAQSNQRWLYPCRGEVTDNREVNELTSSGLKSYIESLPVDCNHWLSNPSTNKDICKWLAQSSSERCKNCPVMCSKGVFKVFDQIASSKDGWLLTQELY